MRKIGLLLASSVVSVLLIEGSLRLLGLSFPVFDIYDEIRGVKLMPGKKGWYRKEGAAYLEINSLGYRDREHDLVKPQDIYRIALLGDSFTEARQMPVEDTYGHRLGEALKTCPAINGLQVEVLNFGIGTYSTSQQILTYDLDVRQFQPDLVLLGFFAGNDIRDNSKVLSTASLGWRISAPFYELTDGKLRFLPLEPPLAWKRWLFYGVQHSRLLELVNEARRRWSMRKDRQSLEAEIREVEIGNSAEIYQPAKDPDWAEAWVLTKRLLAELAQRVRADGARFMVATIPASEQTYPDIGYREALAAKLGVDDLLFPERQLAKFGKDGGYTVFPLVEELQAAAGDRHFHGFANTGYGYGHMNAVGHRAMADLLAPRVCGKLGEVIASSGTASGSVVD